MTGDLKDLLISISWVIPLISRLHWCHTTTFLFVCLWIAVWLLQSLIPVLHSDTPLLRIMG